MAPYSFVAAHADDASLVNLRALTRFYTSLSRVSFRKFFKTSGPSVSTGTHCIFIVYEVLHVCLVLELCCFLSFVLRLSFSGTHGNYQNFANSELQTLTFT